MSRKALGSFLCVAVLIMLAGCLGGGKSKTKPTLQSIAITPSGTTTIALGNTQQFTATGKFSDGSTQDLTSSVTWASSSMAVATISAAGLATSLTQGSTNITATSGTVTSNTAVLTVGPPVAPVLKSIAVTPANKTLKIGDMQQYTATGTFTDGSTQDLTSKVTWASSDPTKATITTGGLATAVANGTTTISATDPATLIKGSTTLTVSSTTSTCPSGNEAVFTGQYAFLFQGYDASGPVALADIFDADGTGKIATLVGVEDLNNSAGVQTSVAINSAGSSYSVGSDNRGCLTIATSLGTSTYRFALGSVSAGVASRGRLIEFDSTGTLGSGEIALQDPTAFSTAQISGSYSFGASSTLSLSTTTRSRFLVVGTLTTNGGGGITTGEEDFNLDGTADNGAPGPVAITGGSYTVGKNGRGTLTLNITGVPTVNASMYVVSANEFLFMSTDMQSSTSPLFAGTALKQSGSFSASSLSGNSVLAVAGLCGGCVGSNVGPHLDVGIVNANGAGSFSFSVDENKGGTLTIPAPTGSGTYTVDSAGRAALTATGATAFSAVVYLVGMNQGFVGFANKAVQSGTLDPQTGTSFTNASLKATFFFGTTNQVEQHVSDSSGVATFDGVSAVTGTSDSASISGGLSPGQAFSDTYSVTNGTGTPGRGTITGSGTSLIFYIVSPTKVVLMDASTNAEPALTIGEQ